MWVGFKGHSLLGAVGTNGLLATPVNTISALELKPEESGKLGLVSYHYDEQAQKFALTFVRINTNGVLDDTYGENGTATIFSLGSPAKANFLHGGDFLLGVNLSPGDVGLVKYKSNISVGVAALSKSLPQLLVYPNPVDDSSVIEFELREAETLSAEMYDMAGKKVNILAGPQRFNAGTHQIALRMGQLPRGSYVLVLSNGKWRTAGRIVY